MLASFGLALDVQYDRVDPPHDPGGDQFVQSMQMAQRDVELPVPNGPSLTGQIQKPDADLKLLTAARDGAVDDVVELRVLGLLVRRSVAPARRWADDVEPAKPRQPGRDFVAEGKPQTFFVLAVNFTEREDGDAKPMTTWNGPMNIRGELETGWRLGGARHDCLRHLRTDAPVKPLRFTQRLDANRFP